MNEVFLFPFSEYWGFYAAFIGFVLVMLAVDLGIFHRVAHRVSVREAGIWSVVWISLAMLFAFFLNQYAGWRFAGSERLLAIPGFDPQAAASRVTLEFLTGFVMEKALSVDNIFVFIVVFSFFKIPDKYLHRILVYGIIGALIFRGIFIALGSVLMQYQMVIYFFGGFLILTGIKMCFTEETKDIDPSKNLVIRLLKRIFPVTQELHGQNFFVRLKGRLHATPLFVTLVFIEATDIVFAVDSVPAIFAVTREPMIVFTSNVFAILGLRALFFLLAGVMDRFYLLKYALAFVLVFVGLKMVWLNRLFDGHFPIGWSLGIIGGLIGLAVVFSLLFPKKHPATRA